MPRQPLEPTLHTEPAPAPPAKGARTPKRRMLPHDFEAWYEQHRPVVYRYVRFRVATREAAEDVTSDVFM